MKKVSHQSGRTAGKLRKCLGGNKPGKASQTKGISYKQLAPVPKRGKFIHAQEQGD